MDPAAAVAAALVVVWAALVIVAHLLNPELSPMAMGMSGLTRGRGPWVMKSAFLCRGASALLLLIPIPGVLGTAGVTLAGIVAFWLWGVGSAALAVVDTDMPGEPPSRVGAAHAPVALATYIAGVSGAILLSLAIRGDEDTSGLAVWALPVALTAAVAMVVQFVAFGAAAREARVGAAPRPPVSPPSAGPQPPAAAQPAVSAANAGAAASAPVPPPLAGVPAQLTPGGSTWAHAGRAAIRSAGGSGFSVGDLAAYAGFFQRVFVGLLMTWTLLVALGIG
jgi:hypothetical protein